jgi:TolB-like protein/DNA-binding winged helix-turn-helix (wHTH) protein/tetratricopeptide (TPR) repeat protein
MTTTDPQVAYEFGQFILVPTEKRLLCDGKVVPLAPKVFDTLVLLVKNQGRLLEKDALLEALWPHSVVEEVALAHNVSQLRKALGDPAEDPKFIETVPKRGYRFIAAVRQRGEPRAAPPASGGETPSAVRHTPRPRAAILGAFAAVLVLAAGTAAYFHLSPTGKRVTGVLPAIHSLAVLPFENLSADKEQEYFADGMTDALTTDLAQIGSLRVISRTSAMQFKGSKETLPQVGRDLQVDALVEGTVARGENRVRVTAQLVEASSDYHLWARTYERDLKDVLALQDEIAQDIAEQIRVKLTPKERSLLIQVHAVDPEALDAYLRGRYWAYKADLWRTCGTSGLPPCVSQSEAWKALEYYQKAIAKDPSYALGYAGVADGFVVLAISGGLPYKEASPKINEAALKALALDPSLAEAHSSLAFVKLFNDWDFSGADAELKQAIALNPNFARAHTWYSYYLVVMERLNEAVKESERARNLDPFDFYANEWLGQALYHARQYDDALRQQRRTLEMFPDRGGRLYYEIAEVYEQKKMFAEAFAARQQSDTLSKCPCVTTLSEAYQRAGWRGYLLKSVQLLEEVHGCDVHDYALLNDEAHAMTCLERLYEEHSPAILFVRTAPELDSIRSSTRFRGLVRRIGLPQPSSDKN